MKRKTYISPEYWERQRAFMRLPVAHVARCKRRLINGLIDVFTTAARNRSVRRRDAMWALCEERIKAIRALPQAALQANQRARFSQLGPRS